MNPFTQRTRIKDPAYFYGRVAEQQELYTLLASMQSCSVVGPRRVGKSSLLYYLTLPEVYSQHLPDSEAYVFGYIDLQELIGLEVDDFFFTAVERFSRANDTIDIDLDRDGNSSGFRRFLARASGDGQRFVLCCDAFEMLSQNATFGVDFFTYLRGLCSNYNLSLVTSSRDSLYELCHQGNLQTSQFWNIFVERSLGLMPDKEAYQLITTPFANAGVSISDQEAEFVRDLSGPHPFFIQIACFHLYEAKMQGEEVDLGAVVSAFQDDARPHYTYGWGLLNNEAKLTLKALAGGEAGSVDSTLFQHLKRATLVMGEPDQAFLSSSGWTTFITEQNISVADAQETKPLEIPSQEINLRPVFSDDIPTLQEGSITVGRYQIRDELGRGGMARVYRAYDPNFGREVALKLLPSAFVDEEVYRSRFEREAQSIASLEHPAIVPVYDFGQDQGQPFLVMRLMMGGSLAERIREGPLDLETAVQIVSRLSTALDEAHMIGIVHRDIKPANILFDQYDNAYLSDFGIAQISENVKSLTRTGIVGTPSYMSPEQIYTDVEVDGRSDLYSLAVMFFETLTGDIPFTGDTPFKIMMRHMKDPVPEMCEIRPDLPQELDPLVQRALSKKPNHRYATVDAFARALVGVVRMGQE